MDLLYRKHEGVALLCQNNELERVSIFGINEVLQRLTGYGEEELKGEPFTTLLASKQAEMVTDYVEYEKDTNDLGQVLSRMRDLKLRHKDGRELPIENYKLVRIDAKDRHHWFRLIIEDSVRKREADAFKRVLAENFKGHEVLDEESGLADRESILKDLELAQYYVDTKDISACFAYVKIEDSARWIGKHGKSGLLAALKHVSSSLQRNLRVDDTLGRVADDAIGVILMDITPESARVVMNRIRWLIGGESVPVGLLRKKQVAVSVAFAPIGPTHAAELPDRCAESLSQETTGFSQLSAVG